MKSQCQHVHIEWESIELDMAYFYSIAVSPLSFPHRNPLIFLFCLATKTAHLAILSTPRRYISLYIYAAYGIFCALSLILTSLFPRRPLFKWAILTR